MVSIKKKLAIKKGIPLEKKAPKAIVKKIENPIFEKKVKNYRIGNDIQPKRDLTRFVKWPRSIRIKRHKKILNKRLKVPPAIDQFNRTLNQNEAVQLFKLLNKYRVESKKDKMERLKGLAKEKIEGKEIKHERVHCVKFGLEEVTRVIETKEATLVCIANDVDPIELVVWMPALCRKMGVPYCIVKNKGRLGVITSKKNAACVAFTKVKRADQANLEKLAGTFKARFNDVVTKKWGGGILSQKSQSKLDRKQRAIDEEAAKRTKY
mmetsp:Transcript_19348/g.28611  ORF Transcript_19348/g.28611 Transcript_19348/m.28611 type:complete len:265 (-) Transcript_19348:120-914(-)|eukprot:CAMPEP_0171461498 /NCGR_PEP_ID=MMETSP0945-20130129/5922_1 /TAXON_ID=109269 /ORGANISM="Vaucheria litorea, Strain CCMP2940" /LENGTH=264 /DNA_ID=CAMNT_0011987857 /DNA_START=159 /DNA_END=953 /DNA_ORIENTATION=+